MVKFVTAVTYHFCLALPAAFTQPGAHLLAVPCTSYFDWQPFLILFLHSRAHRIGQSDSVAVKYLVAKGTADDVLWPMLQKKLDVLNQAGLSKDNFQDSEATSAKAPKKRDSQGSSCSRTASSSSQEVNKITDYFSSSLLADVDFDAWDDDDSFCNDAAESDADPGGGSEAKRLKTS